MAMTLEQIESVMRQMVDMFDRDTKKINAKITAQDLEIAALKAQLQQGQSANAPASMTVDADLEVVGQHPITGRPVTRAMIKQNPKLAMSMAFTEEDA